MENQQQAADPVSISNSIVNVKESRWNRYRVWKPLSLMVLAGRTPPEWQIKIVDENLSATNYAAMLTARLIFGKIAEKEQIQ